MIGGASLVTLRPASSPAPARASSAAPARTHAGRAVAGGRRRARAAAGGSTWAGTGTGVARTSRRAETGRWAPGRGCAWALEAIAAIGAGGRAVARRVATARRATLTNPRGRVFTVGRAFDPRRMRLAEAAPAAAAEAG